MCFSTPTYTVPIYYYPQSQEQEAIATPTYADADVTKAADAVKNKTASLAGRNTKTTPRGLTDEAETKKQSLLGG